MGAVCLSSVNAQEGCDASVVHIDQTFLSPSRDPYDRPVGVLAENAVIVPRSVSMDSGKGTTVCEVYSCHSVTGVPVSEWQQQDERQTCMAALELRGLHISERVEHVA
eukprot:TRINITY_DN13407_c0_g1_i3.p2 TRINITY_DN13407_c0_g1~~TRINITY_DN13407_c0_g1_i3.p2  ORF type:complete len:108 (+),score=1.55 TRINITY_DN13407_c0_g1_i3:51-374(+)